MSGYHSTRDLCNRFRCSRRTIFRRMLRKRNPFPKPCIRQSGSHNLWATDEVAAWENAEKEHSRSTG